MLHTWICKFKLICLLIHKHLGFHVDGWLNNVHFAPIQVNMSSWYFLPLYFQSSRSLTPLESGLLLMPMTVFQAATGFVAGVLINRTGHYLPLIYVGMTLTTLGFSLFILFSADSSKPFIIGLELLAGLGVGQVFQSPLIALQSLVQHDDVAMATAMFGFTRSLSTSVSIVIGGVVFQNEMQKHQAMFQKALPVDIAEQFSAQNAAANVDLVSKLSPTQAGIVQKAYAQILSRMWTMYACFAALGLLASFGIQKQNLKMERAKTKTVTTVSRCDCANIDQS